MARRHGPFLRPFAVRRLGSARSPLGATEGVGAMNEAPEILRRKFLQLFGWEKRKRCQEILTTLVCYSLLAALVLVPIYSLLPTRFLRWFIPLVIFFPLAPFLFVSRRWRRED